MPDVNDTFIRLEDQIGPDIYQRTLETSPWLKLVPKDKWPDGMSDSIQVLTYERTLPADISTWSNVALNDGSDNTCVLTATQVAFAQTLRSFNLQEKAVESIPLCVKDVRNAFKFQEQLRIMFAQLTDVTAYIWKERNRNEYIRLAEHKMVATTALPENAASFPAQAATSKLSNKILRRIYTRLIDEGAGREGSVGNANGMPQFVLITSSETSDSLIFEDDGVRQDFRDAKPNDLLANFGVDRPYRGFYHLIDESPKRWNFTAGAWVEVPKYITAAATKGTKRIVNPAYDAATHEDSIVFVPNVYTCMVPGEITSPGGNVKFDPQHYMGDFKWRNILDRVENPDGNWGYFRGILSSGSKPVRPEFGYVIRHLRCPADIGLVACP